MDFSMQLYSARQFLPWQDVLKKLAGLGYTRVEGFPLVYEDTPAIVEHLLEFGLRMPTGHFNLADLEADLSTCLKTAEQLGMHTLYAPFLEEHERPDNLADWKEIAGRLATLHRSITAEGFGFGWHNHDYEFLIDLGGTCPMTVLMQEAPDLEWEADLAWVMRGNQDPMAWIKEYGPRMTAVHVKDIAAAGENTAEDGWADVGLGVVPWGQIMDCLQSHANVRCYVVEHDNPSDFGRFARRSMESLRMLEGV